MNLKNGYKVVYEKASEGKRTFYASKSGVCDPTVDTQLGETFTDADFAGKVIYEYKGSFYVSTGATPAYDENGVPTDERLSAFDEVFVATETAEETVEEGTEVTDPEAPTNTEDPEGTQEPKENSASEEPKNETETEPEPDANSKDETDPEEEIE